MTTEDSIRQARRTQENAADQENPMTYQPEIDELCQVLESIVRRILTEETQFTELEELPLAA